MTGGAGSRGGQVVEGLGRLTWLDMDHNVVLSLPDEVRGVAVRQGGPGRYGWGGGAGRGGGGVRGKGSERGYAGRGAGPLGGWEAGTRGSTADDTSRLQPLRGDDAAERQIGGACVMVKWTSGQNGRGPGVRLHARRAIDGTMVT